MDVTGVTVSADTLIFDSTRKVSLRILINVTRKRRREREYYIYNNLPRCFQVKGFDDYDLTQLPCIIEVTHTPCDNNCTNRFMFINIHNKQILVETTASKKTRTTSGKTTKTELLECKHCYEEFSETEWSKNPLIFTTCGHTICRWCASRFQNRDTIVCPFDLSITKLANGSTDSLKINSAIFHALKRNLRLGTLQKFQSLEKNMEKKTIETMNEIPKCAKHPYNIVEFLCKEPGCQCDIKVMCQECLLSNEHKSHSHSLLMEQLVETEKDLKSMLKKLDRAGKRFLYKADEELNCSKSFSRTSPIFEEIAQKMSNDFDIEKAKTLQILEKCHRNKKTYEEKQKKIGMILKKMTFLKKEIETRLKMKNDFHDVRDFVDYGEFLCGDSAILDNDLKALIDSEQQQWGQMERECKRINSVESFFKEISLERKWD